ncbi:MAG: sulfatase-like hydrolase/transferase, partial [Candidatus Binatia bacterium]
MTTRPNVLLIVMDCVRFDYLFVYGYPRLTTPHLERLAADGVVFENAFAAAPWTPPSHASLFTGTYPLKHGVDVNENLSLSEQNVTLAEVLAAQGYRTFGVLPDVHLSRVRGFDKGFQDTIELWRIPRWHLEYDWLKCRARNFLLGSDKKTYYTNAVMQRWLTANFRGTDPFFIFANYKTAHNSYYDCPRLLPRQSEIQSHRVNKEKAIQFSRGGGYSY